MIESTARELLDLQERGQATAEEIARAFLNAVAVRDGRLKAFLHVDESDILRQAQTVDAKRRAKQPLGPLAGIPVALKDVLCVQGQATTCGSKMLQQFRPPYDATVVAKLRQADAILFGKTNLDEFAMGSSTENSAYQTTRNPWNLDCVAGGSSGGSAASVAACEAPLSLGTDTGGSVRQPASLCGIVGLKPTYGRVSRFGLIAYGSSLDQVGPFGHDVADVSLLLEAIAGHDPHDSTSGPQPTAPYARRCDEPIAPLTLGVAREHFAEGLDPEAEKAVREAIRVYESLGAKIKEVSLPHARFAVATYYLVATAEASSNLARYDGVHFGHRAANFAGLRDMHCKSRGEGFGAEVKRRIMLGSYALSSGYVDAYYLKALKVRRLIKNDFDQAFAQCDAIVGPTSPTPAFRAGEKIADPLAMYLSDIYTISANLAGIPAVSVPCGFSSSGLPLGLQIHAAPYEEEKLLRIARMHEKATDWHCRRPSFG